MRVLHHLVRAVLDVEAVARTRDRCRRTRVGFDVRTTLTLDVAAPPGLRVQRNILDTMDHCSVCHGIDWRSPVPMVGVLQARIRRDIAILVGNTFRPGLGFGVEADHTDVIGEELAPLCSGAVYDGACTPEFSRRPIAG